MNWKILLGTLLIFISFKAFLNAFIEFESNKGELIFPYMACFASLLIFIAGILFIIFGIKARKQSKKS